MQEIKILDEMGKEIFSASLTILNSNLDFFVLRFYYHFLKTKAGDLFLNTKFENQYIMFYSSLEMIINNIENPGLIESHLTTLVKKHKNFGVSVEHIDSFIDSFIKALQDIFIGENCKEVISVWHTVIVQIMTFFEKKLREI